jgi:hypothetical protein
MPSWTELNNHYGALDEKDRGSYLVDTVKAYTAQLSAHTDLNVLFYASSFLQKPQIPGLFSSVNTEDLNGFMTGVHGMDFSKGLLLMLHTPGGMAEAAESIVDYLWQKFSSVDALIPTYAMSAGTMIALGCNKVIMGRQSQLGPTDPQLIIDNRPFSAHSILAQFEEAKTDISGNIALAHAWAPMLQRFGPALLQEAKRALVYGEQMVSKWMEEHMFEGESDAAKLAERAAHYFSDETHGSHGRRINRDDAREIGLKIEDLEDDQDLQDIALTMYHIATMAFDNGPAAKLVISSNGNMWVKNVSTTVVQK